MGPDLLLSLAPPVRQAIWRAAPVRCEGDLLHAILQLERSITEVDLGLDLLDGNRSRPRAGDTAVKSATRRVAAAVHRRHKQPAMQVLFHSVRGDPLLYARACGLLQRLWEQDRDPRWSCARSDLYMMHMTAVRAGAGGAGGGAGGAGAGASLGASAVGVSTSSSSSSSSSSSGAASAASLPPDPLAPLIVEIHKALNLSASLDAVLSAARALLKRRVRVDRRLLCDKLLGALKVTRTWAMGQKQGAFMGSALDNPVVEQLPAMRDAYLSIIKRPMDMRTMREKAERGEYGSVDDAIGDMALIATNAATYNGPESDVAKLAFRVEAGFRQNAARVAEEIARLTTTGGSAAATAAASAALASISSGDTVALTFEPQTAVVQVLMLLADPLLTRLAVQVAYHSGIGAVASSAAASAASSAAPAAVEADPAALAALTLLAAQDVAVLEPVTEKDSSSMPPAPTFANGVAAALTVGVASSSSSSAAAPSTPTSASASAPSVAYSALACEQLACALAEVLGILGVPDPARAGKGAAAAPIPLPLPVSLAASALRNLVADNLVASAGGATAAASMMMTVDKDEEGEDGAAAAPPAADPPYVDALRALQPLRRGKHLHGRSVSLLATYTAATLFPPAEPAAFEPFAALLSVATTEAGVPELQVLVTLRSALMGVLKRLQQQAPGGGGGGAAGGPAAPLPPEAGGAALVGVIMDRIVLPALRACSPLHLHRALAHKQAAEILRLGVEVAGLAPAAAAGYVRACLETLQPSAESMAAASVAAYPRSLPTLLQSRFLQPLAALWVRPDFEPARAAYSGLVASAHLAAVPGPSGGPPLLDWTALGLAPAAAMPPMPSGSPAGSSFAIGLTPGSGFGLSPFTPLPADLSPGGVPGTPGATLAVGVGGGGAGGGGDGGGAANVSDGGGADAMR